MNVCRRRVLRWAGSSGVLLAVLCGPTTHALAQASIRATPSSGIESTDGKGTVVTVRVTLAEPRPTVLRLEYATVNVNLGPINGRTSAEAGLDYVPTSGELVLQPGETTASFTVTLIDDEIFEGPEFVLFGVQGPNGVPFLADAFHVDDDDGPPVAVPGTGFVNEGDGQIVHVPITLSSPSASEIRIPWKTVNVPDGPFGQALAPDDYVPLSGTLRIPPGRLTGVVDIAVLADTLREPDEFIVVSFGPPSGGGATLGGFFGLGFGVILDQR